MNLLAALLPSVAPTNGPSAASTPSAPALSPADAGSLAQFKSEFDQAVAVLVAKATANGSPSTSSSTTTAQAGTAAVAAQTITNSLEATLQKKIADLLASGASVSDIIQQLAASLATTFAAQFGGNPAEIQSQLQTAFATALSPPGTGPPSATDLAASLAQRFRQIAEVAAGVTGEMGQSNRLFAGSISDAAPTAGVQPAPSQTNGTGPSATADSIASSASAFLASLTASLGDGKTVATNGAPLTGSNGDTLLGRILTRAAQSAPANPVPASTAPANVPSPAPAAGITALALAAATVALGNRGPAIPASPATPAALLTENLVAHATAPETNSGSTDTATAGTAPALSPAVTAFVKAFTDALAQSSPATVAKATPVDGDNGTATLLQTNVSSSQAPTIGAFAPVQPVVQSDSASANVAQPQAPLPQPGTDANSVVEQVLRSAFLNTVGSTSTVRMRLVPESLGDVSVKLTINGGTVDAQVMAQTSAAHDALVAGQGQLTRALADAGLKLASFNVGLAGGFTSFQQQQQQQQSYAQSQSNGRQLLLGGVDTTESDDATLLAMPTFGPPLVAGMNLGALNYLV